MSQRALDCHRVVCRVMRQLLASRSSLQVLVDRHTARLKQPVTLQPCDSPPIRNMPAATACLVGRRKGADKHCGPKGWLVPLEGPLHQHLPCMATWMQKHGRHFGLQGLVHLCRDIHWRCTPPMSQGRDSTALLGMCIRGLMGPSSRQPLATNRSILTTTVGVRDQALQPTGKPNPQWLPRGLQPPYVPVPFLNPPPVHWW
jgi:hypothetical protein